MKGEILSVPADFLCRLTRIVVLDLVPVAANYWTGLTAMRRRESTERKRQR